MPNTGRTLKKPGEYGSRSFSNGNDIVKGKYRNNPHLWGTNQFLMGKVICRRKMERGIKGHSTIRLRLASQTDLRASDNYMTFFQFVPSPFLAVSTDGRHMVTTTLVILSPMLRMSTLLPSFQCIWREVLPLLTYITVCISSHPLWGICWESFSGINNVEMSHTHLSLRASVTVGSY